MSGTEDSKEDILQDNDEGENVSAMEPLVLGESSRYRGPLIDLALQLATASAGFRRSLPRGVATALADLVRNMNCYYSNLIEGHYTHPVEIERALQNNYSSEPTKRNLQLEAKAHVAVQEWVDRGGVDGRAVSAGAICELHRRFCELLPEELLVATNPDTGRAAKVVPGELRRDNVRVGNHFAVSPRAVPRFLERFSTVYGSLGQTDTILATASAHR